MKQKLILFLLAFITTMGVWADSYYFATAPTQVTSITSGHYYVIDGLNQVNGGTAGHFLFDNGTKVTSNNPQALPTDWTAGKFIWRIEGNSTDGYTLQNKQTGKYMSLGSSNGSAISTSSTSQTNAIDFGDGDYATIHNSNGQAIDIGAYGDNPTTWAGNATPGGSRRLVIYEVDVVEIADDACYTIAFNAKTSGNTWGLRSGTTEASPYANATGDVYVAHSYTNSDGNKRWLFINNSDGTYLAYHGQANAAFDMSNAINEWSIASLTAGSGNVSADADCAGKVCITNDKRYTTTTNGDAGCYIVKEADGAYDNSKTPYYNGSFTSALTFTATGDAVSTAATLAIAKFDALQTVKSYKEGNVHIPALFPTNVVAEQESTIQSGINAATTTSGVTTALDPLYQIANGRKFYAVPSTATSYYMNLGTSQITATSTKLNADAVMELEYASNGKYYLKGVKSTYYSGNPNSGSANPGTKATTAEATALYVGNLGSTDNQVYFARTTVGSVEAIHYNSGYSAQGSVVAWGYNAGASQWNITAVTDEEYYALLNISDVTYNVLVAASGTVKATTLSEGEVIGSALAVPLSIAKDYCTYTYYTDAACTDEITTVPNASSSTVYALVTVNTPFAVSTSFADANWHYATLRGKYLRADESAKDDSGRYQTNSTNEKTDAYKWAFFGNPYDNFYVMNKAQGSGKYMYKDSQIIFSDSADPTADNKALWAVTPNSNGGFTLRNIDGGANWYVNDAGGKGNLGFWNSGYGANDTGSNWVVSEPNPVDVTYNVVLAASGAVKATATIEDVSAGSTLALPASAAKDYCTYTYYSDAACTSPLTTVPATATSTVYALAVVNTPFTASTDYATATWYYMNAHASYTNKYISTNGDALVWGDDNELTDAYKWAFIGNPYDGFQVINKAAGDTKCLQETNPLTMGTTAKAWPLRQQTNTSWQSGENGFGFYSDVNSQYVNAQSGTLKYWGSFDQGSTFWAEAVPNYASNVEAEIKPWFENYGGNFQLKTSVVEANQTIYEAALVYCDLATYEELLDLIADVDNFVYPSTGFYRIKSAGARAVGESYIAYGKSNGSSYYGLITKAATAANQDATTIFYINKQSNGKYTMAIQGLNVQAASQSTIVSATSGTAQEYTFIPSTPGYAAMTVNGGTYEFLHESGWTESGYDYNAVLGWTASAGASQWTVEAVETLIVPLNGPIDGNYYATLCVPFACTISGATAYILALNAAESALTMTAVDGTVAAGTPVLLKGTSDSATATIASNVTYANAPVETTTGLTGTYLAKAVEVGTDYFLGKLEGKVGFYHWSGTTLSANRAYFEASKLSGTGVKGLVLDFEDNATGISNLNVNDNLNEAIYNLAGQRLSKMQKGINIVNGKKILK